MLGVRSRSPLRPFVLAAVVLAPPFASACKGQDCGGLGCPETAVFAASLTAHTGESVIIRACHNSACGQTEVTLETECKGCSAHCDLNSVNVSCFVQQDGDAWALRLAFNDVLYDTSYAKDGDVYAVRVTRKATNEVLVDTQETVTYAVSYPNGEACDEEEPCLSVKAGQFASKP